MAPKLTCIVAHAALVTLLLVGTSVVSDDSTPIPANKEQVNTWFNNNVKPFTQRKDTLDPKLLTAEQGRKVIKVSKSGGGNFKTITDAVKSIPAGNTERVVVYIGAGVFNEKIKIERTKPFVSFYGAPENIPTLTYSGTAKKYGTFDSATLIVESDYFSAANLNIVNTASRPQRRQKDAQALALRISGDKAAFYSCQFKGFQDTICDDKGRHFFKDCHIEGTVDFVFGFGKSLYLKSRLYVLGDNEMTVIAAHARETGSELDGFAFVHCSISGTGTDTYLGRAWLAKSTIVYAYTTMSDIINVAGWTDYLHPETDSKVYFGEYKNSGPSASPDKRVKFGKQLSDKEAKTFLSLGRIQGSSWLLPPPAL